VSTVTFGPDDARGSPCAFWKVRESAIATVLTDGGTVTLAGRERGRQHDDAPHNQSAGGIVGNGAPPTWGGWDTDAKSSRGAHVCQPLPGVRQASRYRCDEEPRNS
jgi:hypothetical protein